MAIKVAINGSGRIGRVVLRARNDGGQKRGLRLVAFYVDGLRTMMKNHCEVIVARSVSDAYGKRLLRNRKLIFPANRALPRLADKWNDKRHRPLT